MGNRAKTAQTFKEKVVRDFILPFIGIYVEVLIAHKGGVSQDKTQPDA